jgi:hypothetical protein
LTWHGLTHIIVRQQIEGAKQIVVFEVEGPSGIEFSTEKHCALLLGFFL